MFKLKVDWQKFSIEIIPKLSNGICNYYRITETGWNMMFHDVHFLKCNILKEDLSDIEETSTVYTLGFFDSNKKFVECLGFDTSDSNFIDIVKEDEE